MGFKTQLIALGPELPRETRRHHREGGPELAARAADLWFGSRVAEAVGAADMARGGYPGREDELWVNTFGPLTILGGDAAMQDQFRLLTQAERAGLGSWQLNIHSVVDLCQFAVHSPDGLIVREFSASSESDLEDLDALNMGDPLPFELPYLAGEHSQDDYHLPFHPLELGEAALAWMYGLAGEGAPEDDVQRSLGEVDEVFDVMMHGFRVHGPDPAEQGTEPGTARQPATVPRKGWLRRLFG